MIALHMGGIPEAAMVLGPILLIIAFVRIARRNEATAVDDEEDWDADLGDLGDPGAVSEQTEPARADAVRRDGAGQSTGPSVRPGTSVPGNSSC